MNDVYVPTNRKADLGTILNFRGFIKINTALFPKKALVNTQSILFLFKI